MKLRAQRKIVKGKPRWHLVSSYRDKETGTPRTRHHLYLGASPNAKMEGLIGRINESQKYGKQFHTGKEFQKIREISLCLREEEKWRLWRIKKHEMEAEEWEKNAPARHLDRLRQRRKIYALKKALKPGDRLISHAARDFHPYIALHSKLWPVRVAMTRDMFYQYGEPERWRPELKTKVLEQFAWVEEFQLALNGLHTLRLTKKVESRLSLEKARKINSFAVAVSRLKAAKEALKDMIQVKGQPRTWNEEFKYSLKHELETVLTILAVLKS